MVIDINVRSQVDRMFFAIGGRSGEIVENPVTGSKWVKGLDPEEQQKQDAYWALLARKRFADEGQPESPPLPLTYGERERQKGGGIPHIQALYAASLLRLNYDLDVHPSFEDFACGVMASPHAPDFIKRDLGLTEHFPPRPLDGLNHGLVWRAG